MKRRDPKPDGLDARRMRRILEQMEAHGGARQMSLPWLAAGPRQAPRSSWEQMEFPWAPGGGG